MIKNRNAEPRLLRIPGFDSVRYTPAGFLAFTLVELLVAIAIIAVLAALLLPALGRAKESAWNTVCRNNLHQIALGLNLYAADTGCYVPSIEYPGFVGNTVGNTAIGWFDFLQPYVGAGWPSFNWSSSRSSATPRTGTFVCPSYDRMGGIYSEPGDGVNVAGIPFGAYGYNYSGVDQGTIQLPYLGLGGFSAQLFEGQPFYIKPTRESQVLNPAEMIAFGDASLENGIGTNIDSGLPEDDCGFPDLSWTLTDPVLNLDKSASPALVASFLAAYQRRHYGQFNISFADGHVESGPPSRFFGIGNGSFSTSVAIARRWNNDWQPHLDRFSRWYY